MSDIFGRRNYNAYDHYKALSRAGGDVESYVREVASQNPQLEGKSHNFNALGSVRELQGSAPYGFLLDNLVAVQAVIEEQYKRRAAIERYMPITDVPEDAGAHAVTTLDIKGAADFVDAYGTDAQTIQASATNEAIPLLLGAIVAVFSDEDIRKAARGGVPLRTREVEGALVECSERMARAALRGAGSRRGLINQQTRTTGSTTNLDRVVTSQFQQSFSTSNERQTANFIASQIGAIITESKGVIGTRIGGQMTVALPSQEYNFVHETTLSNAGSDLSIAEHVIRHNSWVNETAGNTVRFERIFELEDPLESGTENATMVVFVSNDEIIEYPVAIRPRVSKVIETNYGFNVPVLFKASDAPMVKRPAGMRYATSIRA